MKKYFSNKFIKINCLNSFMKIGNISSEKPNKLIILTASGIFIGTLKDDDISDNYEINDDDDMMTVYHKLYLEAIDKLEKNKDNENEVFIAENPISITLENVEILSIDNSTNKTTMPFVEIFIDQIIGFSLGSLSEN